ncbi:polysaccharide biosynthesis C-terminal domain-containing protein [Chryseomicrobium palamuruense]
MIPIRKSLTISSLLLLAATIFLKFSGLARDLTLAYFFGDSDQAGAYLLAFILPNMFILFFTTGMKNSFVPTYIDSEKDGNSFFHFSQVARLAAISGLVISILGIVGSMVAFPVLYPEFDDSLLQLTILVTSLFFVAVFFTALNSVYEAYLDSQSKYSISVFSQTIVLLFSIGCGVLFAREIGVSAFAYGYVVGTIVSFMMKRIWFIPKKSHKLLGKLDRKESKRFLWIFIPVAITVMVGQVNLFIDSVFASRFSPQAVTYLNYAKNLVHFPQAIIGVTIGTIIFPLLAKAVSAGRQTDFRTGVERGLTLTAFFMIPALAGMMWLMEELITILYERGAFSNEATQQTRITAYFYIGSVIFFTLQNTLNKAFYSRKKGHIILRISLFSIALNVALNLLFIEWLGSYLAIPLASSVMALVYFLLNLMVYRKMEGVIHFKKLVIEWTKILLATAAMIGVLYGFNLLVDITNPWLKVSVHSGIGAIAFGASAYFLRIESIQLLVAKFRKR